MSKYILRNSGTLLAEEKSQIADLIAIHYGEDTKQEFLNWRVSTEADFDIVLLKEKEIVLCVSFYHTSKEMTPFCKKKVLVIQFGIALKHHLYEGNVIWKMGRWYARKKAGILFPIRQAVGVSFMSNPRVYENFIRLFPVNYPGIDGLRDEKTLAFIRSYAQSRMLPFTIDDDACYVDTSLSKFEITDSWAKYAGARNSAINQFFIERGITTYENGRYYRSGKHLIACGYRAPLKLDFSIWKKPVK
ncbi:hypothetical protein K6119_02275 [Paracrocinitomix mangrovi]|uniref:hypothetical protein n=1 Tax=Paracrocinitomix mangrovi TaxID=2862509 RepID=UPI001C8F0024|nr:hypothetical protein [Paracrocinitomix mangrovi]UKN02346.1 hypothetical protein K6119_02275 [Paracrocinitomix mangrovi]